MTKVFSYVLQEVESEQQKPFKDYLDKNATVLEEAVKKIDAETKTIKDTEICHEKNDIIDESVKENLNSNLDGASSCKVETIGIELKNDQTDVIDTDEEKKSKVQAEVDDDAEKPLVEF